MMKFLDSVLCLFRECFSRAAPFMWFVTSVIGMMTRDDRLGVTSVIRSLGLRSIYEPLVRFFRSDAFKLPNLENKWAEIVNDKAPIVRVNGAAVLIGDGVKQSKEGRRIPGVKKLHQESEVSSKPTYIDGLMYGCVGVLIKKIGKTFCIPLACEVQAGVREIMSWDGKDGKRQGSHVVEMISLACRISESFGKVLLLLDRYFLTVPVLRRLSELDGGIERVNTVIMAKRNAKAYEEPPVHKPGDRGRPRLKGATVKLVTLFDTVAEQFEATIVELYGKMQKIRYYSTDLLWGSGLYRKLRFVLVEMDGRRSIIASTDIALDPLDIVSLYAMRFGIEIMFKSLKHDVAAFTNRFWTRDMPKLKRYAKSSEPDRAKKVKEEHARKNVRKAFDASEVYVFCGVVATGLLQMLSVLFFSDATNRNLRYLRTPSKTAPSEATVAEWLRKNIYRLLISSSGLAISKIIIGKMDTENGGFDNLDAS